MGEQNRVDRQKSANHAWLPGAMVEVEIVRTMTEKNEDGREVLADLLVEIKHVFTGPKALKGERILVNSAMAFRFPPDRWCAFGIGAIFDRFSERYPPGRKGLLWIFQRKDLPTNRFWHDGNEFSFPTGFVPVWEQLGDSREWDETRSMMEELGKLPDFSDDQGEIIIRRLSEHRNAKVQRWAQAALTRVIAMDQVRESESDSTFEMIGIEVLTLPELRGKRMPGGIRALVPGTAKVTSVFFGHGFREGEILPWKSRDFEKGAKVIVSPKNGWIFFENVKARNSFSFPPQGRWDGKMKLLATENSPEIDLGPYVFWFEKLSAMPPQDLGKFLDEAVREAPLPLVWWALQVHHHHLRPETLAWLKKAAGFSSSEAGVTSSLRHQFLYDHAKKLISQNPWGWGKERVVLFERIVKHPLANEEDARIFIDAVAEGSFPSVGNAEDWARLAHAARSNQSWKARWLTVEQRGFFDQLTWTLVWAESRAKFDPSPAIAYLEKRWAEEDLDVLRDPWFVADRGHVLARSLPLTAAQVAALRDVLAARIIARGEKLTPEEQQARLAEIRSFTWDEILRQPFP